MGSCSSSYGTGTSDLIEAAKKGRDEEVTNRIKGAKGVFARINDRDEVIMS